MVKTKAKVASYFGHMETRDNLHSECVAWRHYVRQTIGLPNKTQNTMGG